LKEKNNVSYPDSDSDPRKPKWSPKKEKKEKMRKLNVLYLEICVHFECDSSEMLKIIVRKTWILILIWIRIGPGFEPDFSNPDSDLDL
jgi:hypothetical protein